MTYNRPNEYTLGDKMKKQFSARGAAIRGMSASSTSELLNRAKMGHDPRVNCSEEAFFENYKSHKSGASEQKNKVFTSLRREPGRVGITLLTGS